LCFLQVIGSTVVTIVLKLINFVEVFPNTLSGSQNKTNNLSTTDVYHSENLRSASTHAYAVENETVVLSTSKYQYCGVNDCQNAEIIEESIDQYVPTNQITLYVLTGCLLLMMAMGLVCHVFLVPEMLFSEFNQIDDERKKDDVERKTLKKVCLIVNKS